MEAIAAHVILLRQVVGYGVEICVVGHGAVEGVVKHAHLRHLRHELVYGAYALEMSGVVYGREVAEALYTLLHALVHDDALLIEVAALHDAVSHGIYLAETLYCANLWVEQALEHEVHAFLVVGHVVHYLFLLAVRQCHFYKSLIKSDTLHATSSEHRVVGHVVELVFNG